ncbi:ParA family protein [Enterococcus wangshanyuanii]|uniref:ParA family protein n=1 Tax=Enterococcus wangshanyuanii TaxID=2005703 RepID=A0ABQ1PWI6_9ENTE|nr:AAA family ATPase [Enterococcus wangshanyuanii]GGD05503.1 ParA family protein [Enterococcus wangshanyuanii]
MNNEESMIPVYNAKTIAPSTNKGGVLKTTIAVNAAGYLAKQNNKIQPWRKNKVLLIDIDSQGNVSLSFGLNPDRYENSIYDVLVNNLSPEKAIVSVHENIDILPANDDMAFFELDVLTSTTPPEVVKNNEKTIEIIRKTIASLKELKKRSKKENLDQFTDLVAQIEKDIQQQLTELTNMLSQDNKRVGDFYTLLRTAIEPLKQKYDFIIIDTPPQLGVTAANVFTAVDDVLIPFHPEKYSFRSMIKTIRAIDNWKESNPALTIKAIIPVKVKEKTITHSVFLENSEQIITSSDPIEITKTYIPESIKPAEAIAKYNLPFELIDEKDLKTKKDKEQVLPIQNIFDKLFEELGY